METKDQGIKETWLENGREDEPQGLLAPISDAFSDISQTIVLKHFNMELTFLT